MSPPVGEQGEAEAQAKEHDLQPVGDHRACDAQPGVRCGLSLTGTIRAGEIRRRPRIDFHRRCARDAKQPTRGSGHGRRDGAQERGTDLMLEYNLTQRERQLVVQLLELSKHSKDHFEARLVDPAA